jgi:hypothetical protein
MWRFKAYLMQDTGELILFGQGVGDSLDTIDQLTSALMTDRRIETHPFPHLGADAHPLTSRLMRVEIERVIGE